MLVHFIIYLEFLQQSMLKRSIFCFAHQSCSKTHLYFPLRSSKVFHLFDLGLPAFPECQFGNTLFRTTAESTQLQNKRDCSAQFNNFFEKSFTRLLIPCPFTGLKMFWADPNFLCQTKNLFTYCGSHKHFVPDKKMICIQ